jgi:hypothetical protein
MRKGGAYQAGELRTVGPCRCRDGALLGSCVILCESVHEWSLVCQVVFQAERLSLFRGSANWIGWVWERWRSDQGRDPCLFRETAPNQQV